MKPLMLKIRKHPIITFALISLAALAVVAIFLPSTTAPRIDSYAACAEAGYPVLASSPPVCKYYNRTFVGPTPTPQASSAPVVSVPFTLLVKGDSGGDYPNKQEIFTTPAGWARYWSNVHAGIVPMPPRIPVDFKAANVVALSLGQRSTGGYGLKITGILEAPNGTTVSLIQSSPGPQCTVTQSIINPYLIVQTKVLIPPVNFRITDEKRPC